MTRDSNDRNKFLQALREVPFINRAAKKVGIHPSTIYRWIARIPEFRDAVEDALVIGRENLVEAAESLLVKKIKEEDLGAAKFFLTHNSPRYKESHRSWKSPPMSDKEKSKLAEQKRLEMIKDAFVGPDGKITVSDETMKRIRRKQLEQEERKKQALGSS